MQMYKPENLKGGNYRWFDGMSILPYSVSILPNLMLCIYAFKNPEQPQSFTWLKKDPLLTKNIHFQIFITLINKKQDPWPWPKIF